MNQVQHKAEKYPPFYRYWVFIVLGIYFGLTLIKSEVVSWFRIQEMFHLDSFHLYGVIGSAVIVGIISLQLIKRLGIKNWQGDPIVVPDKPLGKGYRYWIGGTFFGLGWGMTGACPGPIYALIGYGFPIVIVVLLSAVLGTYVYGLLKSKLPH